MTGGIRNVVYLVLVVSMVVFSGCGGGGGDTSSGSTTPGNNPPGQTPLPSRVLSWEAPTTYVDSTPMNPVSDLDRFEIYVNGTGAFADTETPIAALSAVDSATNKLTTTFDLASLGSHLTVGPHYYVSMRAVALTGQKSDFSSPISFSF